MLKNNFWIEAAAVTSKTLLSRQVDITELHAIWDFEGKLESKQWSQLQGKEVLRHRILSLPAKIVRILVSKAADAIVNRVKGLCPRLATELRSNELQWV